MKFEQLAAGMSADRAIEAFLDGCNRPARMNISSYRRRAIIPDLRRALPDPITAEVADALIEIAHRRRTIEAVIRWLALQPMSWQHYVEVHLVTERRGEQFEEMARSYESLERESFGAHNAVPAMRRAPSAPEAIEQYRLQARPCPKCATQPPKLRWLYYCSSRGTWENLVGRAGWMTVCDTCRLQIDFFIEILN